MPSISNTRSPERCSVAWAEISSGRIAPGIEIQAERAACRRVKGRIDIIRAGLAGCDRRRRGCAAPEAGRASPWSCRNRRTVRRSATRSCGLLLRPPACLKGSGSRPPPAKRAKPVERGAQPHHLADDDDRRRFQAGGGNGFRRFAQASSPAPAGRRSPRCRRRQRARTPNGPAAIRLALIWPICFIAMYMTMTGEPLPIALPVDRDQARRRRNRGR